MSEPSFFKWKVEIKAKVNLLLKKKKKGLSSSIMYATRDVPLW